MREYKVILMLTNLELATLLTAARFHKEEMTKMDLGSSNFLSQFSEAAIVVENKVLAAYDEIIALKLTQTE